MASNKSTTPDVMYSWRVDALASWISAKEAEGHKVDMKLLSSAGHLDQYHYLGLDANNDVKTLLGLDDLPEGEEKMILDVGCGIGGPARHISWKSGCKVVGVDIQPALINEANRVCKVVELADRCAFLAEDCSDQNAYDRILKQAAHFKSEEKSSEVKFDGWFSILTFLHIPMKARLSALELIANSMAPGAPFCIEDYVLKTDDFTEEENHLLKDIVGASYVPDQKTYQKELESVGFTDIHFEDMTDVWTKWVDLRYQGFLHNQERQKKNTNAIDSMQTFYSTPPRLFATGKLAGARITGRMKVGAEDINIEASSKVSLQKTRDIIAAKKTNEMSPEEVMSILQQQGHAFDN